MIQDLDWCHLTKESGGSYKETNRALPILEGSYFTGFMQVMGQMQKIPVRQIAAPPVAPSHSGRFSIRQVSDLLGGNDLVHPLHKHDFFFILALEKGEGTHEIDFTRYDVEDNVVFILRPGQVHQLQLKAGCSGFLLEFDPSFYQPKHTLTDQQWKKAIHKNHCQAAENRFNKLFSALTSISTEFTTRQEGYREAIKANLDIFFIEYIRQSRDPQQTPGHGSNYTQERFEELSALLETHITRVKQVSHYAELLHLSPYQLNAITKATVGKTTAELISEQVILEAKRQLLATPNQIKDIAWHLGYEDASYFIRFFKKHTGHSPDAFRKNYK
jgi:AraC-like DNA-binding protein/quercetin dioxygenase-like cupin family protein